MFSHSQDSLCDVVLLADNLTKDMYRDFCLEPGLIMCKVCLDSDYALLG